jgi:hypothetical protein
MPNATFDLERLEASEGAIVVSGRWTGVRGMRFMRPTLTVGTRRLLATLEHKPWAPDDSEPWVAAFPWTGDEVDATECWLDVAPGVLVPLVGGGTPRVSEVDELAAQRLRFERRETEVDYLRSELRRATGERDRALEQRDEAMRDCEAAMRTRERMEAQRDEALERAERARAEIAAAEAERDDARAQRDAATAAARDAAVQQPQSSPPVVARPRRVARLSTQRLTAFDVYAFRVITAIAAACAVVLWIALVKVFI